MAVAYRLGPSFSQGLSLIGKSLDKSFPDQNEMNRRERQELQLEQARREMAQIRAEEAAQEFAVPLMEKQGAQFIELIGASKNNQDPILTYNLAKDASRMFTGSLPGDPNGEFRAVTLTKGAGPQLKATFNNEWIQSQAHAVPLVDLHRSTKGTTAHKIDPTTGRIANVTIADIISGGRDDDELALSGWNSIKDPATRLRFAKEMDREIDANNPRRLMTRVETDEFRAERELTKRAKAIEEAKVREMVRANVATGMDEADAERDARALIAMEKTFETNQATQVLNIQKGWSLQSGESLGPDHIQSVMDNKKIVERRNQQLIAKGKPALSAELSQAILEELNASHPDGIVAKEFAGLSDRASRVRQRQALIIEREADMAAVSPNASKWTIAELRLRAEHLREGKPVPTYEQINEKFSEGYTNEQNDNREKYFAAKSELLAARAAKNPAHPVYDAKVSTQGRAAMMFYSNWLASHGRSSTPEPDGKIIYRDSQGIDQELSPVEAKRRRNRLMQMTPAEVEKEIGLRLYPHQVEAVVSRFNENSRNANDIAAKPGGSRLVDGLLGIGAIRRGQIMGLLEKSTKKGDKDTALTKEDVDDLVATIYGDDGSIDPNRKKKKKAVGIGALLALGPNIYLASSVNAMSKVVHGVDRFVESAYEPHLLLTDHYWQLSALEANDPKMIKDLGLTEYKNKLDSMFGQLLPRSANEEEMSRTMEDLDDKIAGLEAVTGHWEQHSYIQDAFPNPDWKQDDRLINQYLSSLMSNRFRLENTAMKGRLALEQSRENNIFSQLNSDNPEIANAALEQLRATGALPQIPPGSTMGVDEYGNPAVITPE